MTVKHLNLINQYQIFYEADMYDNLDKKKSPFFNGGL